MSTVTKIGQKCTVGDGAHASIPRVGDGIPYLSSKNFTTEGIDLSDLSYISLSDYEKHFREHSKALTKPKPGDLILSIIGSIGAPYLVRDSDKFGISSSVAIIRPKDELDSKYLFYYLKSSGVQNYVEAIKSGAAQGFLSLEMIKSIPLEYPSHSTQQRIAATLSAYDDLIENNTKRITLLEQMAEQVYKEWFVRMRFPGYENTEFEKGLPKGWEIVELKSIAKEVSKSTKPGMHLNPRLYLPMELMGQHHVNPESYFDSQEANSSLVTFEKDDILFGAMRPYQHKVNIAPFSGITRTTSFVLRPKEEGFYSYLFLLLFQKSTVEYATLICNGSDRPYVVWNKSFEKMKVLKPNKELLEKFELTVRPILQFISNTFFVIENLKQTRDLLLPRLINGKLRVKEAKKHTPLKH